MMIMMIYDDDKNDGHGDDNDGVVSKMVCI